MASLRIKRGTRAQLNSAASGSGLKAGEPYLITDESRFAVGLTTGTYQSFLKEGEATGGGGMNAYTYDGRAALRALDPTDGDASVVNGLGLFVWEAGSTEPDDDESCFATASGAWLMQAASWDLIDAWQAPDQQTLFESEDGLSDKILHGSATCTIVGVAATSSASFVGVVPGAAVGDVIVATPPGQLGNTSADTGRLSYYATVSSPGAVLITLANASAAYANTNAAIRTNWSVVVIKK